MHNLTPFLLAFTFTLSSCIVAVAPVHDNSAVRSQANEDHVVTFSFANLYDRDSSGGDKPGGIRMMLKMNEVGPMRLRLRRATVSRNGGPWQSCNFGKQAYNAGGKEPYNYSSFEQHVPKSSNYFNVLILCPAETTSADRSSGYAGIDPLKRGTYEVRVYYTLNGREHKCRAKLKLSRKLKAGAGTILDALAPWSSINR